MPCYPAVYFPVQLESQYESLLMINNNHSRLLPLEVWKSRSEGERAESVQYPGSEWSRRVEGSQSQCRLLLVSQPRDRVTDTQRYSKTERRWLKTQCYSPSEQLETRRKASIHMRQTQHRNRTRCPMWKSNLQETHHTYFKSHYLRFCSNKRISSKYHKYLRSTQRF